MLKYLSDRKDRYCWLVMQDGQEDSCNILCGKAIKIGNEIVSLCKESIFFGWFGGDIFIWPIFHWRNSWKFGKRIRTIWGLIPRHYGIVDLYILCDNCISWKVLWRYLKILICMKYWSVVILLQVGRSLWDKWMKKKVNKFAEAMWSSLCLR